ncbi:hypothetical protein KR054_010897 [Drosophila jambulina]|nr:hypothetical protein KR054_010897 [Drosophila jambulina]
MLAFDNELDIWECAATLMIGIIALNKVRCDELKMNPSKGSLLEERANHWNRMMTLQCRYLQLSKPRNMTMDGVSEKTYIQHNSDRTIEKLFPVNYQEDVQGSSVLEPPEEYPEEEYQEDVPYSETEDYIYYTPTVGNDEDWQILFYEINPNIPKDEEDRVFVTTYILHNVNPSPESIGTNDEYQEDLQDLRTEEYEEEHSDSRCFISLEENEEDWHGSLDDTSQNISELELESNGSLRTSIEEYQVIPSDNTFPIKYLCMGLTFGERRQSLLHWCKVKLHPYGIPVCDFTTSWKNGRALVALIHCYHKYFIGDRFLTKESPRNTLDCGEKFARSLGVNCSTDIVEECLKKKPSQFKIMPFVEELRTCLEATIVRN